MKYLISIVLPVYNAENHLNECIRSVLGQTYQDFELIIIDDGSTDKSIDIINNYKAQDKRIRVIKNDHNFIKSLNLGIAVAEGKYIARMDADDIMLPHRLEIQYKYLENNSEIDICGSWAEAFGAKKFMMKTYISHHDVTLRLLLNNTLFHPTVMMRKKTIGQFPGYPNLYKDKYPCAEDYKLWTELAVEGYRFVNIPEVLLKYRLSENQTTNVRRKEMLQTTLQIRVEYAKHIMEKISNKDEQLKSFFKNLNGLVNEGKIGLSRLPNIIYSIYLDYK